MLRQIILTLFATPFLVAAVNYSYDNAGRLVKIDYGSSGSIAYTYDKSGNLTSRSVQASASSGSGGTITSINTAGAPPSAGIAQNTWIEIRGTNLVPATTPVAGTIWSDAPEFAQGRMPTQLGGINVTVNNKPAYVSFFCSVATSKVCATDQVNVLTPLDTGTGDVQVVVSSAGASSAPFTVALQPNVPSFFRFGQNYVVAIHANGTVVGPTSLYPGLSTPANPNEEIVLYGTGFGLPAGGLTAGSSSQSGPLPTLPVCKIGTDIAAVAFAGLSGPGLIQVNLTVPGTAKSNDRSISCTYNGATTPAGGLITIH